MPRSKRIPSGRTPSLRSPSSAAAKSARRKRVREGADSEKATQRCFELGSRSTAISSPSAPRRSAIARACPPAPKVQSRKVSPGRGSSSSTTSWARTGSWSAGTYESFAASGKIRFVATAISASFRQGLGDVADLGVHALVLLRPPLGRPDLEPLVRTDHHRRALGESGVLDQLAGEVDAAGRVELLVEGVRGEIEAHVPPLAPERVQGAEEALGEALVPLGRERPDGGVKALEQNNPVSERRAELGRNREAILRVETVFELAAKRHCGFPLRDQAGHRGSERAGEVRWEEPHHPGPLTNLGPH